jgi:hypothetical protein
MTGVTYVQRLLNEAETLGADMDLLRYECRVKAESGAWTYEEAVEKYVDRLRTETVSD